MVPSIANWPVCKSGGVQFAGVISNGGLKPVVEKVDFQAPHSMPVIEAMSAFAQQQLLATGKDLFCASWAGHRFVFCQETEPMVLLGSAELQFDEVLKNIEQCETVDIPVTARKETLIEWDSNLDRHFWNFLQIVERTSASRTLLLGFGLESFKLGISEGAIHEPGKLMSADAIVKRFRSTARARRKITYYAGARRRKHISSQPIMPLELAKAFSSASTLDADQGSNSISWILDAAGWPVKSPQAACFEDFKQMRLMYGDSSELLQNALEVDKISFCLMNMGEKFGQLYNITRSGLSVEDGHSL